MAQHDYDIANQAGAAFRSDLNAALAAIVSNNSGSTAPSTTFAYQFWADTTSGLLKQRNAANNAWITIGTLASANLGLLSLAGGTMNGALVAADGTAALPGITFPTGTTDTGLYCPGADQVGMATAGVARFLLNATGYASGTVNGLGSGLYQAQQFYRLNTTFAGSNATGAQSLLGVGVTLVGSTVYEFEIAFGLAKTAGTTSHTLSLLFGGTATLNNIQYIVISRSEDNSTFPLAAGGAAATNFVNAATAQVISGAFTNANATHHGRIKGTVSVNAGGTFIPQYSLSSAPGGAYTTQIGSRMKIAPLGAAGTINIGTWA